VEATVTVARPHTPRSGGGAKTVSRQWTEWAACRAPGLDPELFFPVGNTGPALMQVAEAKRVCASCPVTVSCLAWALYAAEAAGIWGGTTPEERRMLRRA
jgi:WhiB family redox-sensing transcriptional regulator